MQKYREQPILLLAYQPSFLRRPNRTISLFSFVKFQDKETSGSILHFLITWGLTSSQFQKAQEQLRDKKGIHAKLMGAVIPDVKNDVDGFCNRRYLQTCRYTQ